MNHLERSLIALYALLLRLFPPTFRAEFASEMQEVFFQALRGARPEPSSNRRRIEMIRLFLREIVYLPAAIWSALEFRPVQVTSGIENPLDQDRPAPKVPGVEVDQRWIGEPSGWKEALLGAVPFLLYGLAYLLIALSERSGYYHADFRNYAPQMVFYGSVIGLLAGCARGFPRWSYGYLGMVLHFTLDIFNEHFSVIVFGQQIWIPVLIALGLGLLIARSFRSLEQLLQGVWRDWPRLAFLAYAALLPIYTIIFFDSDWGIAELYGLGFDTLILAAGAVVFLRSQMTWQRVVSLQVSMFLLALRGILFLDWSAGLTLFLFVSFWTALLLIPVLFSLVRWGVKSVQAR